MRTQKEFSDFYESDLVPDIEELEQERLDAIRKMYLYGGPTLAVSLILTLILAIPNPGGQAWIWVLVIGGVVCLAIYTFLTSGYVDHFKERVIKKIIQFIDPNLQYDKDKHVSQENFVACKLFALTPNRFSGDDYVIGQLGQTQVAFSEIHASRVTGSGKNRRETKIFDGLFFMADFHKDFKGQTLVLPDRAEKMFGGLGTMFQSWNKGRGELVKLEDPVFEKEFAVYGTDQVEARYILTPAMMERLMELKRKAGGPIYVSFIYSRVYIAISYRKKLLEPKVFSTLLSFADIQEYFTDLRLATGIVEDLNLNTRIWTKE